MFKNKNTKYMTPAKPQNHQKTKTDSIAKWKINLHTFFRLLRALGLQNNRTKLFTGGRTFKDSIENQNQNHLHRDNCTNLKTHQNSGLFYKRTVQCIHWSSLRKPSKTKWETCGCSQTRTGDCGLSTQTQKLCMYYKCARLWWKCKVDLVLLVKTSHTSANVFSKLTFDPSDHHQSKRHTDLNICVKHIPHPLFRSSGVKTLNIFDLRSLD